eukprot:EG_transcript_36089
MASERFSELDFKQQYQMLTVARQQRQPRKAKLLDRFYHQRSDPLAPASQKHLVMNHDGLVQAWAESEALQLSQEERLTAFLDLRAHQDLGDRIQREYELVRHGELTTKVSCVSPRNSSFHACISKPYCVPRRRSGHVCIQPPSQSQLPVIGSGLFSALHPPP